MATPSALAFGAVALLFVSSPAVSAGLQLSLPISCNPGTDCFVQQFPDMKSGPGVTDPFCGPASYDGHQGTDIRVLSMADVGRGVPVLAVAEAIVMRVRDGVRDHLVVTQADRDAVGAKECGNGLILRLADGLEAQYCHLRRGSIAVRPGQAVKRGQRLGMVGASGMAAFPHVHVTIRKGGVVVDPNTGRALTDGCSADPAGIEPLWKPDVASELGHGEAQIMALGLAGGPVDYAALGLDGPPRQANARSPAHVGWGWFINLRGGDRVRIVVSDASGNVVAKNLSDPMDHSKAAYSAFAGKRGAPAKGRYTVDVTVLRNNKTVAEKKAVAIVR